MEQQTQTTETVKPTPFVEERRKTTCKISDNSIAKVGGVVIYSGKSVEILHMKRCRDARNGVIITVEDNGKKDVHSNDCTKFNSSNQ